MIAERRAGLFSAVVLFLSPLRPCQRRMWIGARFSKAQRAGKAGGLRLARAGQRSARTATGRPAAAPLLRGPGDLLGKQGLGRAPLAPPPQEQVAGHFPRPVYRFSIKMCQFKSPF